MGYIGRVESLLIRFQSFMETPIVRNALSVARNISETSESERHKELRIIRQGGCEMILIVEAF